MTQYTAYLTVGSFTTWLHAYRLTMTRDTPDMWPEFGSPPPFKSTLKVVFTATSDALLTAWIDSAELRLSGTITCLQTDLPTEDRASHALNFSDALCVSSDTELIQTEWGNVVRQTLLLTPNVVTLGLQADFASWPPVGPN